jgi:hypothetical protein
MEMDMDRSEVDFDGRSEIGIEGCAGLQQGRYFASRS